MSADNIITLRRALKPVTGHERVLLLQGGDTRGVLGGFSVEPRS